MKRYLPAFVAIALVAAACSTGSNAADTTLPDTSTTTSTSQPPETTTTVAETTTSTTLADTTTSTSQPPETTTTMSGATDSTFVLSGEGIQAGRTWVPFGYDADDAVDAFSAVLGPPSRDSGWLNSYDDGGAQFGACPGPHVRGVAWGNESRPSFEILLTDADTDFWSGGVEHFYTFYYFDRSNPRGVKTTQGIGVGSSVGQLKAAYSGPDFLFTEAFFDPAQGEWSYRQGPWTGLWGFTTGLTDEHVVESINGGHGCGE